MCGGRSLAAGLSVAASVIKVRRAVGVTAAVATDEVGVDDDHFCALNEKRGVAAEGEGEGGIGDEAVDC